MANEISLSAKLSVSKNSLEESLAFTGIQVTFTGTNWIHNVQSIATTETALQKGSVGTPGICIIKNLDSTNFVSIRHTTGGSNCVKIKAGEAALVRFSNSAPYLIADTAAVRVEYLLLED